MQLLVHNVHSILVILYRIFLHKPQFMLEAETGETTHQNIFITTVKQFSCAKKY